MKNVEIYFYVAEKAFFFNEILEKKPILSDFSTIWRHFGPNFTPPLTVTTLFIVVYAPKGILINENSENLFLNSEKKHFLGPN